MNSSYRIREKMPEGPEVRITADSLHNEIAGDYINDIIITKASRYYNSGVKNKNVVNYPIYVTEVDSRGKKIRIRGHDDNGTDVTIVSALGMEGNWRLHGGKHAGIELEMNSGKTLYFHDTRHFGTFHICINDEEYNFVMKDVGPDWLRDEIDYEEFDDVISSRRIGHKEICWFLMEQKFFSGIGNYLLAEVLYASRVLPYRKLSSLGDDEKYDIWRHCRNKIQDSYESQGMTISTYFNISGERGSFECVCYGQRYDPNGYPIIKGTFSNGRTSHYCPDVQY